MANSPPRVYAVLPAAGRSRRMGADKQLIAIDGQPMLAVMLDALSASTVNGIAVVTHQRIAQQMDLKAWPDLIVVANDDEITEMIDSIRLGVKACYRTFNLQPQDGLLITPADMPGLTTTDIDICIRAFHDHPDKIIMATHNNKKGHPIIIPATYTDFINSPTCNQGLNALPQAHPEKIHQAICPNPRIHQNLNTPRDLPPADQNP